MSSNSKDACLEATPRFTMKLLQRSTQVLRFASPSLTRIELSALHLLKKLRDFSPTCVD
jgi:hypothetical protein